MEICRVSRAGVPVGFCLSAKTPVSKCPFSATSTLPAFSPFSPDIFCCPSFPPFPADSCLSAPGVWLFPDPRFPIRPAFFFFTASRSSFPCFPVSAWMEVRSASRLLSAEDGNIPPPGNPDWIPPGNPPGCLPLGTGWEDAPAGECGCLPSAAAGFSCPPVRPCPEATPCSVRFLSDPFLAGVFLSREFISCPALFSFACPVFWSIPAFLPRPCTAAFSSWHPFT
jgi:hypothetical protein